MERFAAAGGAINVLVDRIGTIAAPDRMVAEIKDFSMLDEQVRRGRIEQGAGRETEAAETRRQPGGGRPTASGRPRTSAPSRHR